MMIPSADAYPMGPEWPSFVKEMEKLEPGNHPFPASCMSLNLCNLATLCLFVPVRPVASGYRQRERQKIEPMFFTLSLPEDKCKYDSIPQCPLPDLRMLAVIADSRPANSSSLLRAPPSDHCSESLYQCNFEPTTGDYKKLLQLATSHGLHRSVFLALFKQCAYCHHIMLESETEEHMCATLRLGSK